MTSKQAVEARLLIENPLYQSYRDGLEAYRERAVKAMLKRNADHVRLARLAGEVTAIDFALGLPADLLEADPVEALTP